MMFTTIHNGKKYRMDYNPTFNTSFLVHKSDGRYIYMNSEMTWKFRDAVSYVPNQKWIDFDDIYEWIWTNAGFHRYAA